jgi:hypothetical protein
MMELDPRSSYTTERFERLVPDENPVMSRLKAAGMLAYNGDGYGSELAGKFYPEIPRDDLIEALMPYSNRIGDMKWPVVVCIPDPRQYSDEQLNRLHVQCHLDDHPIEQAHLIEFPSKANLPESWDVGQPLKDRYAAVVDDRRMPLDGQYYESPFPGWTVLVCERKLGAWEPSGDPLDKLADSNSSYVQLTSREAFMMHVLGLTELSAGEKEVLFGHYDAVNDSFPVMHSAQENGAFRYKVKHMNASDTRSDSFSENGEQVTCLQARTGFRLQSSAHLIKDYCEDILSSSSYNLQWKLEDLFGESYYGTGISADDTRAPGVSVSLRAIKEMVTSHRDIIAYLLEAYEAGDSGDLRRQLAEALADSNHKDAKIAYLEAENDRLKRLPSRSGTPRTPDGLQITPENIRTMKTVALKKLEKALGLCFHPDVNEGRENKKYSLLSKAISEELARRGAR